MRTRAVITTLVFAFFIWKGGWAGFGLAMLVVAMLGILFPYRQPQEISAEQSRETPRNNGVLVPARRGKPDPTRPDWRDEMSGNHYERKRQ